MKDSLIVTLLTLALSVSASDKIEKTPQAVVITDPATVYQKAFWRHPKSDDKIVHAERREWLDTNGSVMKWQWFLIIEPSPQTRAWLDTNPFLLTPSSDREEHTIPLAPPEWFDSRKAPKFRSHNASLSHAFTSDGNRLFATDTGGGFTAND
ncbi:hypothetical protein [Pelagicoccus sp. SDUM812002]|uniref:hypothetical protein n=1 Tax=Pelagicoccus sp. SDUM812002 TaxID=3041266 RepID=UPI00280CB863|nr:hypothetical protein [Pelagicoccus sp. SDUM812002]MDQ8188436.1 hypothetical protein [Pelagicoccus sp. SDUM812002]